MVFKIKRFLKSDTKQLLIIISNINFQRLGSEMHHRTVLSILITLMFSIMLNAATALDNTFVEIPTLPKFEKPQLKEGESAEAFEQRVRKLHEQRIEDVFEIQKAFRLEVEDRNRRLLRGEERQSPSLVDPYDPLFTAYASESFIVENSPQFETLLERDQKRYKGHNSWLFIVSIEKYQHTDPVLFARRTAEIVKATFQKKLDISERNIVTLYNKNATLKNIDQELRKLLRRVQRNDVVYFYYCGHGLSNKAGEQLILPYDGMPDFLDSKNTLKLERMYNKFLNSRALRTFSFIDASFNGITEGVPIQKGLDKVEMRPRAEGYHKRLNILNSARGQDTANAYLEKGYRLFSYFLAQEVLTKEQNAGALFDSIRTMIREVSYSYGEAYLQEPEFFGYRELMLKSK